MKRSRVIAVGGWAPSLAVDKGDLVITQAVGGTKEGLETQRYPRGVHTIQSIVMLAPHGKVSVDALRWCQVQRVGLFILDGDGVLVSVTTPSPPFAVTLRRAQHNARPLELARAILQLKIVACIAVRPKVKQALEGSLIETAGATTVEQLRLIEARAATAYWTAWHLQLNHYTEFPEHWRVFEQRSSGISGGPRKATHPVNAILIPHRDTAGAPFDNRVIAG